MEQKKVVILGGGGFIGGHLAKRLKSEGCWVRICDLKEHEYFFKDEICDEFIVGDLTHEHVVDLVIGPNIDEVYQLAADMGGAGYIFTGENDANVMYNSALINLHVAKHCVMKKVKKVFYSSSACMYPEHNQLDPNNPNCEESSAYPANPDSEYGWEKLFSERVFLSFHRNYGLNVRIARFHNIFGPQGTWKGGREKSPAAMCRKVVEPSEYYHEDKHDEVKEQYNVVYKEVVQINTEMASINKLKSSVEGGIKCEHCGIELMNAAITNAKIAELDGLIVQKNTKTTLMTDLSNKEQSFVQLKKEFDEYEN